MAIDPETGACEVIVADGTGPRLSADRRQLAYVAMERPDPATQPDAFKQRCSAWVRQAGENAEPQQIWIGDGHANICWERGGQHVIVAQYERLANSSTWTQTNWRVDVAKAEAAKLELPENDGVTDAAHHSDRIIAWRLGNRKIQLVTMSYEGGGVTALTRPGQYDYKGRFSPDDEHLLFLRREKGEIGVYVERRREESAVSL